MAANNYKIVLFYNQYQQGFTETWYFNGTLVPSFFLTSSFNSVAQASMSFRHPAVTLIAARYSIDGQPRSTFTQFFGQKYAQSPVQYSGTPDPSSLDLLIKLYSVAGQYKHMYIRGLNQADTTRGFLVGDSRPSASLISGLQNYLSQAWSIGWGIKTAQTVFSNPALWQSQVQSVAPHAANPETSDVQTLTMPVFSGGPPFYVRFARVPHNDLPGFPRQCQVILYTSATPGVITVPWRYRANLSLTTPQNMAVYQNIYSYWQLATPTQSLGYFQPLSFLERKTGKAFFTPRGRTRAAITRK